MRNHIINSIFLLLLCICSGCSKKEANGVRIVNNYTVTIYDTQIGSVSYGTINPGEMTDYIPFKDGTYDYSGKSTNGWTVSGSVTLPKKRFGHQHDWSLTLDGNGAISFVHDK